MRISDWSSDVCSSDLPRHDVRQHGDDPRPAGAFRRTGFPGRIERRARRLRHRARLRRLTPGCGCGKRDDIAGPMTNRTGARDGDLGGEESPADVSALGDAPRIRAILIAAARAGRSVSYSELLGDLGFPFTRPKMRAVRKTLEEVERLSAARGEPHPRSEESRVGNTWV